MMPFFTLSHLASRTTTYSSPTRLGFVRDPKGMIWNFALLLLCRSKGFQMRCKGPLGRLKSIIKEMQRPTFHRITQKKMQRPPFPHSPKLFVLVLVSFIDNTLQRVSRGRGILAKQNIEKHGSRFSNHCNDVWPLEVSLLCLLCHLQNPGAVPTAQKQATITGWALVHQKLEVLVIGYDYIIKSKIVGTITKFIHLTPCNLHPHQHICTSFTLWQGKKKS